jgi:hypothetical protein
MNDMANKIFIYVICINVLKKGDMDLIIRGI